MLYFHRDNAEEIISEVAYDEEEVFNGQVVAMLYRMHSDFEWLRVKFNKGEVDRVLDALDNRIQVEESPDDPLVKPIRGVKVTDVALIALNYGFMYGAAFASQMYEGMLDDD